MAVLAKMMSAMLIFQTLHLALANANANPNPQTAAFPRIRKTSQPISLAELPDYSQHLSRRGGVLSKPSVWPRTNLALDSSSCSSYASYLAEVMDNIEDMLGSAISGLGIIRDTLGKKRNEQTDDERAKMDFFMSMYGLFDPTRKADIARARARILDAESFAQKAADGLDLDTLKTTIFCNDDHLVVAGINENGDEEYISTGVPAMTPIDDMSGKCAAFTSVLAFMMTTTDNSQDVMAICPRCWKDWSNRYISQYYAKSLSDVLGESLDDIANGSPEVTLLHELSHAESFFGTDVMGVFPSTKSKVHC
ncbi:hypothetical protein BDW68DRAFT_183272 [Aspergillus falconensis]